MKRKTGSFGDSIESRGDGCKCKQIICGIILAIVFIGWILFLVVHFNFCSIASILLCKESISSWFEQLRVLIIMAINESNVAMTVAILAAISNLLLLFVNFRPLDGDGK